MKIVLPGDGKYIVERVWYCRPEEIWRGKLARHIHQMFVRKMLPEDFLPEDWDRMNGYLLGYPQACIDFFIERNRRRS